MSRKRDNFSPETMELLFVDPATGEEDRHVIPTVHFWALYNVMQTMGVDYAYTVALYGAMLVKPDFSDADNTTISDKISAVNAFIRENPDREETALKYSYQILRSVKASRPAVAQFASDILGKEVPADSWRKRVDAWAAAKGLPKVGLYKHRM